MKVNGQLPSLIIKQGVRLQFNFKRKAYYQVSSCGGKDQF